MKTNWVQKLVGVAAVVLAMAGTSYGTIYYWSATPANEEYTNLNNWKTLTVPLATDDAYFTNWMSQTVKVSTPITNRYCRVYGGTYTFDQPGSNLFVNLLGVGNTAAQGANTNTMIFSGNTYVTVGSGQSGVNIKDATQAGTHVLKLLNGAKIVSASLAALNGGLYHGGFANRTGDTNIFIIDGAGSRSDFTSITMSANSLNALYLTNGGAIGVFNSGYSFYMNHLTANKSLVHKCLAVVGGGSPASVANVGYLFINQLGNTVANWEIQPAGVAKTNTSEMVILANGLVSAKNNVSIYPGGTLTLSGGQLALLDSGVYGVLLNYGMIQGAGEILLQKNGGIQNITLATITNASNVAAYGEIAPGSAGVAGTIVVSNYTQTVTFPTWLEVRPGCKLKFDLGGASVAQYDRILCTNMYVYLGAGTNASTYTVQGGAIIDVALMNGWQPSGEATFDVLSAKDIMDTSLAPVTFNYPTQPAGYTWSASIVTNINNEVLRITAKSSAPKGTVITVW